MLGKKAIVLALFLLAMSASSCSLYLPEEGQTTPGITVQQTASVLPTTTALPTLPLSSATLPAQTMPGSAPLICNLAAAGQPLDVSIPDDTRVKPGEPFTKTWRLVNTGQCDWDQEYQVVWFSAERMNANDQKLSQIVNPGDSVDVSVDMVAPDVPGVYQSYWKLRAADGELFGIGPSGSGAFWVRVVVVSESTSEPLQVTESPTPEPVILVFGSGSMMLSDEFDLDKGRVSADAESDFRFAEDADQAATLKPVNGSRMVIFGVAAPSISACQSMELSVEPINVNALFDGAYLCYQTSQQFPGFIRIDSTVSNPFTFEFLTWALP